MGTKSQPGSFDCYAHALPDEPLFVLLARDPHAPGIVRQWAYQRRVLIATGDRPQSDYAMTDEAEECAGAMERWRTLNDGKWRNDPASDLKRQVRRALEVLSTLPEDEQRKMWEDQRRSWTRQERD